jgi:hypothetical protein
MLEEQTEEGLRARLVMAAERAMWIGVMWRFWMWDGLGGGEERERSRVWLSWELVRRG